MNTTVNSKKRILVLIDGGFGAVLKRILFQDEHGYYVRDKTDFSPVAVIDGKWDFTDEYNFGIKKYRHDNHSDKDNAVKLT